MPDLYSQRNRRAPAALTHLIPERARQRILAVIEQELGPHCEEVFDAVADRMFREHGTLYRSGHAVLNTGWHPLIDHCRVCPPEHLLDVLEAVHDVRGWDLEQRLADEVNRIFGQEGVGYRLTNYQPPRRLPGPGGGIAYSHAVPPQAIRIDSELMHEAVTEPALQLLADPRLAAANRAMLTAYAEHRAGHHDDAITSAGSALESALRSICAIKGWEVDDRMSLQPLLQRCGERGLFPMFYVDALTRLGTIRNRLGDAHGRGPDAADLADDAHAAHMLACTAASIRFVCQCAGLA